MIVIFASSDLLAEGCERRNSFLSFVKQRETSKLTCIFPAAPDRKIDYMIFSRHVDRIPLQNTSNIGVSSGPRTHAVQFMSVSPAGARYFGENIVPLSDHSTTFAEKFELVLSLFPHPDRTDIADARRRRWKGTEISAATGSRISPSYLSGLKSGRIKRPGLEQLNEISAAMGFPFELWLEDIDQWPTILERWRRGADSPPEELANRLAERINSLFLAFPDKHTGEPYSNRAVADASDGSLTEHDLAQLRDGTTTNPTQAQLLALSDFFDVEYAYWLRPEGSEGPVSDELLAKLRDDEKAMLLTQKAVDLDEKNKDLLLLLAEQLDARDRQEPKGRTESGWQH